MHFGWWGGGRAAEHLSDQLHDAAHLHTVLSHVPWPVVSSRIGANRTAILLLGLDNVGTNLLNKNLSIQPTLTIRPGYAFNVLVNRTMILPPYLEQ